MNVSISPSSMSQLTHKKQYGPEQSWFLADQRTRTSTAHMCPGSPTCTRNRTSKSGGTYSSVHSYVLPTMSSTPTARHHLCGRKMMGYGFSQIVLSFSVEGSIQFSSKTQHFDCATEDLRRIWTCFVHLLCLFYFSFLFSSLSILSFPSLFLFSSFLSLSSLLFFLFFFSPLPDQHEKGAGRALFSGQPTATVSCSLSNTDRLCATSDEGIPHVQ